MLTSMCVRSASRGGLRLAALLLGLLLVAAPARAAVPEYELKLALLFNIAKFVTWPGERGRGDTLSFCMVGGNPFDDAARELEGRRVRGRTITVSRLRLEDDAVLDCDIAFIDRERAPQIRELLVELAAAPVLTVSDAPGFAEQGGVVGLSTRNSRVAIEINQRAQERSGLVINAQLLRMATLVETGNPG
ncbi:MAG: YfiR family protein [Pseudomonadales bacterium]|jgi:hypothetical protein|nr:YfiR family protein [Pseudomonadales bacterium]